MNEEETTSKQYIPTVPESEARTLFYQHLQTMRELKEKKMPHFQNGPNGARSFLDMIDDSEALLNLFTPSRAESDKQDWQSNANIGGAETRAKMRAIAAGVGLKVPEMAFQAVDGNGIRSTKRAEIFKHIVKETYSYGNAALTAFLETWQMLAHGVVFEYEGYKTGGAKQDVVVSFDTVTGEVKTEKKYIAMDGRPFNVLLNPQEFYFWTFFKRDVQDQPRIAWVQKYTRREIELEFSKYPNYKYIRNKTELTTLQLQDSDFFKQFFERTEINEEEFEVARMYSKEDDSGEGKLNGYEIWINGVPILRCPLLWGDVEKVYPFAKQVPEYFANSNFFVGLPFPMTLEGSMENKNMLVNSLVDKVARGLDPVKLVGLQNRDLLDVESSFTTQDSTIYVPDINAVKFMEHPQINQGELMLIQMLNQGIELISIDRAQQGIAGGVQKTARESVIADQRAQELKGNLYLSLDDLWYQKTRLRVSVVLSHYIKDKAAAKTIKGRIISIDGYSFGDNTRGTLDIYIAKTKGKQLTLKEIAAREAAAAEEGLNYKIISVLVSYIDKWQYDFKVVPMNLRNKDRLIKEDELMAEISRVTQLFPEFFVANKSKYLGEILALNDHSIEDYKPPAPPAPPQVGTDGKPVSKSMLGLESAPQPAPQPENA